MTAPATADTLLDKVFLSARTANAFHPKPVPPGVHFMIAPGRSGSTAVR